MADTWTVADAIAAFLKTRRIARTYGLTGGEVTDLIGAIERVGIDFVLTHHESCAAYMADAEAQLAGRPGVCISTVGPGATNMVNGVANAFLDRTPLMALIGDMDSAVQDSWTHMTLDLVRLFQPVSKLAARITPDNVYSLLPEAWATTMAGPQGPACLMLAAADAVKTIERRDWSEIPTDGFNSVFESAADRIVDRLKASRSPVLVLGLAARSSKMAVASAKFASHWGVPTVLTPKAKGYFPADADLYAGVYASYGSGGVERLLSESDLILGVGLDGSDFIRPWRFGSVVSLSENAVADTAYPSEHHRCDIVETLAELAGASGSIKDGIRRASEARREARRQISGREAQEPVGRSLTAEGIDPIDAIAAVRRAVPANIVLTCDVGMLKLVICQYWPSYHTKTFLVSNGLSTMGYGLPAATSASMYLDGAQVVTMIGDGGLLMCAGELETLARCNAAVTVIVAVDSTLGLIRLKAENSLLDGAPNDFRSPDYVALAGSFGINAARVESAEALANSVTESLAGRRSTLIECPIEFASYRRMT